MIDRTAFARSLRKRMTPEEVKLLVRLKAWRGKGYRIARLWNADINHDPDASADTIWAILHGEDPLAKPAPHPVTAEP